MSPTMKNYSSRSRRSRCLAVVLSLACLLLAGCSTGKKTNQTLRVGVALYTQDDTFISTIVQNLEWMAQDAESQTGDLKLNLSIADGRSNQTTQMDQIDQFLARGYDVLCVNIVDRTAAAVIIDKAQEADVPLIFFNRQPVAEDIQRWERTYYVGARAEEGGILQGQLVAQAWQQEQEIWDRNGDGVLQYVMLEGEPGHQDALLRTEYSIKALTDAGLEVEKLVSDTANWSRSQAAEKMSQWLAEFGDGVEAVFSNNDDMALGAVDAYREAGLDLPLVVGVDATSPALEAIRQGELYGTVLNDAQGISRAMLDLILTLERGEDPAQELELEEEHYIWLPYQLVTRDNYQDFLPQSRARRKGGRKDVGDRADGTHCLYPK
ncbi:MAG: galactose ABC transporter substrate-binding protein [Lawsonibacter sp.]|jgi:methyl-galactoside transport system substrate-binding protein